MRMVECYIGLGGNFEKTQEAMVFALNTLVDHESIFGLETSRLYATQPISSIAQPFFLNAVCRFQTTFNPKELFRTLQMIETELGKVGKPKDAPRLIDLDILFYGSLNYKDASLTVPHPKWRERLFVLTPLADLTGTITLEKHSCILSRILELDPCLKQQKVYRLSHTLPFTAPHLKFLPYHQ
jgi:2-amino-4-hydroxy-6-hydroxymethyldihydropteridine diphosphokinase